MKRFWGMIVFCLAAACGASSREGANGPVREPLDKVGYVHEGPGFEKVLAKAAELESAWAAKEGQPAQSGSPFTAVISPHDDYTYAARVYLHAFSRIEARHIVLFGVAHHAKDFPASEGKLVFESFGAWHGPYGDVPISPLREDLIAALPSDDVLVSDEIHEGEHSLEGIVPFLQNRVDDVRIVPILVPYMSVSRIEELAERTGAALASAMKQRGLTLGRDVAIVISSDSVHYGDEGWSDKNFADFGTDGAAYDKAVARDLELVRDHLVGPVSVDRLAGLYGKLVKDDFHEYRVSWCGRFSIPFGLAALLATTKALGSPAPSGALLRYGTTLDPGATDYGVPGMGVTAPANLHHWVGFAAIGYR
ncbi:MAG: AmmeMemoRadiSam system protein B [Deltaproteobacteria bacterium]|nr:AmmeMemoRadiSam system protein B [Deltaproteobacteria bacterium]